MQILGKEWHLKSYLRPDRGASENFFKIIRHNRSKYFLKNLKCVIFFIQRMICQDLYLIFYPENTSGCLSLSNTHESCSWAASIADNQFLSLGNCILKTVPFSFRSRLLQCLDCFIQCHFKCNQALMSKLHVM